MSCQSEKKILKLHTDTIIYLLVMPQLKLFFTSYSSPTVPQILASLHFTTSFLIGPSDLFPKSLPGLVLGNLNSLNSILQNNLVPLNFYPQIWAYICIS